MNREEEDRYKRALATIENMRKQTAVAVSRARDQGEERVAVLLMDAIDDFQRATDSLRQDCVRKVQAIHGIDMAIEALLRSMLGIGIQAIYAQGEKFDPSTMEAVAQVPSSSIPPNHVTGQIRLGYLRKGKLLRPAQVAVSVNAEENQ